MNPIVHQTARAALGRSRPWWRALVAAALLGAAPALGQTAAVCAVPGKDGPAPALSGIVNTYYAGSGSPAGGTTSLTLGAKRAASEPDLAAGDLLLIMQMQDGGGSGSGSAGVYEYAKVASVAGNAVTLAAGLVNSYVQNQAGRQTFQVVRVPQYASATVSGTLTAEPWTVDPATGAATGGIVALDVTGELQVNGQINVQGLGFRGGAGRNLRGNRAGGAFNDAAYASDAGGTGAGVGNGASKGEGNAGTPRYVFGGAATPIDYGVEGYATGSYGRAAAGNAGGGGNDGTPATAGNTQNSGGGGGGNGGVGGKGGNSWSDNNDAGGRGGAAASNSAARLGLGGGGGAGSSNNNDNANSVTGHPPSPTGTGASGPITSSGASGGGIVLLRAGRLSASGGSINADGNRAYNVAGPGSSEGSGGGGAGGSVFITAGSGSAAGLAISALGGRGGDAYEVHGAGGGGGGGFVLTNIALSPAAAITPGAGGLEGSNSGATLGNDATYNGDPGQPGSASSAGGAAPGTPAGYACLPALTVTKTTTTAARSSTDTTASYTVVVAGAAGTSAATGVQIVDDLPSPFTFAGGAVTPVYAGGATGPASLTGSGTDPVSFGTPAAGFAIPGGGSVTLTFTVNLNGAAPGTYQNPASVTYDDPTGPAGSRATPGGPLAGGGTAGGSNFDPASSAAEDVTIGAAPPTNPNGICVVKGGKLGSNLFAQNGSFGTVASTVLDPPTLQALPAGRTTYTYNTRPFSATGNYSPEDGEYNLANSTYYRRDGAWHKIADHTGSTTGASATGNNGLMMVVNAAFAKGVFYEERLSVTPDSNYEYSLWIINLIARSPDAIKPDVTLEIDRIGVDDDNNPATADGAEGQVVSNTGPIAYAATPTWINKGGVINSGSSTQIIVRFRNNAPGGGGNDLAIDDLSFTTCDLSPNVGNLSGTLYLDNNDNGALNPGEPGVGANVAVELVDASGLVVATAQTDAGGKYSFKNIPVGTYTVRVATNDPQLSTLKPRTPAGATRTGVAITPGANITDQDFGFLPPAPPPVAGDDSATTPANTPVNLNPPSNDTAGPGATLVPGSIDLDPSTPGQDTVKVIPGQGRFELQPDGQVKFTPEPGFTGTATSPYTIKDSQGQTSNAANLSVTVAAPNQPPVAQDGTNAPLPNTAGPTPLGPGLRATDPDGTVVSYTVKTLPDPAQGTLTLADGSPVAAGQVLTPAEAAGLRFTPKPGFVGNATFTYTATDNQGAVDATPATYTIPVVSTPKASDDTATTPFNTPVTLTPVANDTPGSGGALNPTTIDLDPGTPGQDTVKVVPGQGKFELQPDGTVKFTPEPGFTGTATTPYTIKDASGQISNAANLTVTVGTPPPPVAKDDSAVTRPNTPVTLPAPGNDTASPGTTLVPGSIDLDPSTPGQDTVKVVPGQGKFELQPDGLAKFTPEPGFTGTATIPYTIKDSLGQTSNVANLTVTVPPAPVATDDSATTPFNTPVTLPAPANDTAGPGATLVPGSIDLDPSTPGQDLSKTVPGQGKFELQPDGTVKFTPEPGFTGTATAPYTIKDNLGQTSNPANLTVTVGKPAPPVAANDKTQTPLNTPVTLNPPLNDTASPGTALDPTTIDLDPSTPGQDLVRTVPGQGTFAAQPDGTVKFTPVSGFTGTATTPYTIKDKTGQSSNVATLTVDVLPLPAAIDDAATTPLNTPVTVPFAQNDVPNPGASIVPGSLDLDPGTPGQDVSRTIPGQGTFELQPDGTVKFTPEPGFTGTAEVPYTVKDSTGGTTNPATIRVTVVPGPAAKDDSATTKQNTPVTLNPVANDTPGTGTTLDPTTIDLDPITPGQDTVKVVPGQGKFELQPDGTVKFTPEPGFTGTATTPYTIKDSLGQTSNPANLTVTVAAPPKANDDASGTSFGTPVTLPAPGNDTAGPGATLVPGSIDLDPATPGQQTSITVPGKGTFELNPATGGVTFTPVPGFTGTVTTPYTIGDTLGQTSNPANLSVTVGTPPAPVANPDSARTKVDTPVTLTPLTNDTPGTGTTLDPTTIDLDPNTPGVQTSADVPGKGRFETQPDGAVKFTPAPGFTGTVTVPYTVSDSLGQPSNRSTLTVTILPLPYAEDDRATTPVGTPVKVPFANNDTPQVGQTIDPTTIDLDPATPGQQTSIDVPGKGKFELQPDGTVQFSPAPGFAGTATVPYTVRDTSGTPTNVATISVTVTPPPPPLARDDNATTPKNTPVTLTPVSNDTASPGASFDPTTIDLDPSTPGQDKTVTIPGQGTFTLNPDGTVTFTPQPNFTGVAKVPYTIRDNYGQVSNVAVISVTIGADTGPTNPTPPSNDLTLEKTALSPTVTPGGSLAYELRLRNNSAAAVTGATLTDPLPLGLSYKPGSSQLNGAALTDPAITVNAQGRQVLTWTLQGSLASGASATVRFTTVANAALGGGSIQNTATARASGPGGTSLTSAEARAVTRVVAGVFSDAPTVVGRVYIDVNGNRNFERGLDEPVRGARVYLSNGRSAATDRDGRYSFTDLPPGLYALRLDPLTVPYAPESVPDDQGRPGTRYGRTPAGGGLVNEDFPLLAPRGDLNKARSTTVTRGPVSITKTITPQEGGYLVTLTIKTTEAVTNLRLTDPTPAGAARSALSGATASGDTLTLAGPTPPGTRTVTYALTTAAPASAAVTDIDLTWDEVQP